jgi:putrescine aminotransferase
MTYRNESAWVSRPRRPPHRAPRERARPPHHIHPFTDTAALAKKAPHHHQGRGIYLWDSEGNKILDGMAACGA